MDYQKTYNQLIERAQSEKRAKGQGFYYEAHHIIPTCLGGDGKVHQWRTHKNIVLLTAKEHRVAHACLHLIHPSHSGLALAYVKMYYGNKHQSRNTKTTSKLYQIAVELAANQASAVRKGKHYEDYMHPDMAKVKRQRHSQSMLGRKHTPEAIIKMKKPKPLDFGLKIRQAMLGRVFKESTLEKMRTKERPIVQMYLDYTPIKVWRSARYMSEALGINSGNIPRAIKQDKICGGFRWKYMQ